MTNIVVPELGESVVEARVAKWLKKEGDRVEVGEPVVELETEKIDLEVNADKGGILASIKRQEGEDVKIGELLAVVDETAGARPAAGGNVAAAAAKTPADVKVEPPAVQTPKAAPDRERRQGVPADSKERRQAVPGDSEERRQAVPGDSEEPRATPTARRMAREHDVNLGSLQGSGSAGRVMKQDVKSVIARPESAPAPLAPAAKAPPPLAPPAPPASRSERRVRMTKRRETIARRLVEAQRTAAMLTTFNDVDMSAVMALRERRKEAFKKQYGVSLGIASFFVKAGIAALRAFPQLNAEIQGNEIVYKDFYDIGMAVGAEGGLVVPVLRDADRMSFAQVELAIRDFAARAGNGTLTLEDLVGGTFTITNGGVFGSLLSTPILNPPQVGILGLHRIQDRAVPVDREVVIRPMMYVALSYDHRIVDGREAVQFLVKIKEFVEDPAHLLLES